MPKEMHYRSNFTAGELSTRLDARIDIGKYANGVKTLLNCTVMPHGGALRRGGTRFIAEVANSAEKSRLMPFEFSTTQAYVIEFSDQVFRFYKDQGTIVAADTDAAIVNGTFDSDLSGWTASGGMTQSAGTALYAGGDTMEQEITVADDTIELVIKFKITGVAGTDELDFQIGSTTGDDDILSAVTFGVGWHVYSFTPTGNTTFFIQFNDTDGTPALDDVSFIDDAAVEVDTPYLEAELFDIQVTQSADILYIAHKDHTPMTLERTDHNQWSVNEIVFTSAPAEWVANDFPSIVTFYEQRLVWANSPSHPQRIWFSVSSSFLDMTTGAEDEDAMVYTIASDQVNAIQWLNPGRVLAVGTAGGEFVVRASSADQAITPTNVRVTRETNYGSFFTLTKRVSSVVLFIQRAQRKIRELVFRFESDAFVAPNLTLLAEHITQSGMVEMDYQQEPDSVVWTPLTNGKLIGLTYQRDQEVVAHHQHVIGGVSDTASTRAKVETVAVIPGTADDGAGRDEVWVVVNRLVDGSTARYVELMEPGLEDTEDQELAFFVDSGLSLDDPQTITGATAADPVVITTSGAHGFSNGDLIDLRDIAGMTELNNRRFTAANVSISPDTFELSGEDGTAHTTYISGGTARKATTTITGLSHLEGESVDILGNGAVQPSKTVSSGSVTLDVAASIVHVGKGFISDIITNRIEAGSADGPSQGKIKRIAEVILRVRRTLGLKVGPEGGTLDTISFRKTSDAMDTAVPLFTGDVFIPHPDGYTTDGRIHIRQDQPLPMEIQGIAARVKTNN